MTDAETGLYWRTALSVSLVKLLLVPAYHSTDFEVHRHWLSLTHSLPLSKWYYDETSLWTLDYPPFFAWFELLLAQAAKWFDPDMLVLGNLDYKSKETILFQRLSVVVADIIFLYGSYRLSKAWTAVCSDQRSNQKKRNNNRFDMDDRKSLLIFVALVTSPGLVLVDHIHFQYNGFLMGISFLSVAAMVSAPAPSGNTALSGWHYLSAALFAIVLNLKHLFLCFALVYFTMLLRLCVGGGKDDFGVVKFIKRLLPLAITVIAVFGASLGPFLYQLPQVVARLFPFKRGLCHAYWAPNAWAIYNVADKVLTFAKQRMDPSWEKPTAQMTGGMVTDEQSHLVLPQITPNITIVLILLFHLPMIVGIWKQPSPRIFVRSLVYSSLTFFMFGWHVHEKAIIMTSLFSILAAANSEKESTWAFLLNTSGHLSLTPLLYESTETPFKLCIIITYVLGWMSMSPPGLSSSQYILLSLWFALPQLLYSLWPLIDAHNAYPFLPLIAVSTSSAVMHLCLYTTLCLAVLGIRRNLL